MKRYRDDEVWRDPGVRKTCVGIRRGGIAKAGGMNTLPGDLRGMTAVYSGVD